MGELGLVPVEDLDKELENGGDPNRVVVPFLGVRLVHYWAELGSLPHLKVLYRRNADFMQRTRMGTTARDELERNVKNKPHAIEYIKCLEWFDSICIAVDR